ncbi:MAG: DUF1330 domain-containing protein [Rhizobiaceae bacterium]|nr:DUF1330 domain-containing protein [Rhizobiaceae bacterium]
MADHVNPEREMFKAFAEMKSDGPVHMLNLVRFKETATYEDGTMVSGAEAYAAYGRDSAPILSKVGGRIVWSGDFDLTLIGPGEEVWDIAFIAEYPSSDAFVEMVKNEDYQRAVRHRTAGVQDSRLIRMSPKAAGEAFG